MGVNGLVEAVKCSSASLDSILKRLVLFSTSEKSFLSSALVYTMPSKNAGNSSSTLGRLKVVSMILWKYFLNSLL